MSGKKNLQENTEQKEQKVVTKYDLKMQRRKEEKERAKRQERINNVIGIAVVVALVCLVASFPIRTYLAIHETYVKINDENITRTEFDYNYNLAKTNYINQYGYYLSYMGYNTAADPATQMYSETMTWKDFFDSMAVENMTQNKALKAEAKAEGFTYDTAEEYAEFEQALKETAAANDVSVKEYIKEQYGSFATMDRIKPFVEESMFLNAYYEHVKEVKAPSEEEITARYQENTDLYDSVDYRMSVINAELPTEPTDLADTTGQTGSDAAGTTAYEPSQEEVSKAMSDARELANAAQATIAKDGELIENGRWNSMNYSIRPWLYDELRKAGDTTVIEDTSNNCYYVVAFESRYRNETPSANIRALITNAMDGQDILNEWQSGEATEESFAKLCKKYSTDGTASDGGLYEGLIGEEVDEELAKWIYDSARKNGDTTVITDENGNHYVLYYISAGEPAWKLEVKNEILNDVMNDYMTEITEKVTVEDPKGKLNYLKVQEAEGQQESEDGTGTSDDAGNDSNTESGAEAGTDAGTEAASESSSEGTQAAQ